MLAMVVLVGNANAAVRVCKMMSNPKSTAEIEVENIMNRRKAIRGDCKVFC